MPAPSSTNVDLNIVQRDLGNLKSLLQDNQMTEAKALSTAVLADLTALNVLIQAADDNYDLPANPTLA